MQLDPFILLIDLFSSIILSQTKVNQWLFYLGKQANQLPTTIKFSQFELQLVGRSCKCSPHIIPFIKEAGSKSCWNSVECIGSISFTNTKVNLMFL